MRKITLAVLTVLAAVAWVLLDAAPAWAHAEFDVESVPGNTDQPLVINVPNERSDDTFNVDVVVSMADDWKALGCTAQPTWTCKLDTLDGRPTVHFTKVAGAAAGQDEQFSFTVHSAPAEGTYAFPTLQTYSNGEVVRWISAAGTDTPAPSLQTTPGPPVTTAPATTSATTGPPTSTVTIPSPASSTTASSTTASTAASTTTSSTTAGQAATTTTAADTDDGGNGWVWFVVIAVVVVGAAGGVYAYRRARRTQPTDV